MRRLHCAPLVLFSLLAGCKVGTSNDPATSGTLLPLAVSRVWGYQITNTEGSACAPNDNKLSVERQTTLGGRSAYVATMPCGLGVESSFAYNGNQVLIWLNNAWVSYIDLPLQSEHSWNTALGKFTWDQLTSSVNTPAGTFSDCYQRLEGNGNSFVTFCHSVGIVEIYHDDGSGHVWDALLASKPF